MQEGMAGAGDKTRKQRVAHWLWRHKGMLIWGVVLAVVAVYPLVSTNEYYQHILTLISIYAIMSLGLNLITGFTGILTFAQAAFAGVGAYATALLLMNTQMPYLLTLPISFAAAGVAGLLLGLCTIRAGGIYFSVITIGFNEIFRLVATNWSSATGGATGLVGIPLPGFFGWTIGTPRQMFYYCLIMAALTYVFLVAVVNSRFGQAIKAIRDDPIAASSSGINVRFYTVASFVLGTALAGLAGNLMAVFMAVISPTNFSTDASMLVVVMGVVGGLGSLPGAVLGAAVMIAATEALRSIYQVRLLLIGVLMVVMPIWRRGGLLGQRQMRRI
jgi:branched-chain amino acid transport system permease protein